jgi:LacI family transcriptional regulator
VQRQSRQCLNATIDVVFASPLAAGYVEIMPVLRRVALLIETSRHYGRELLRGVMRFQRECDPWSVYFEPHGLGDPAPRWLATWDGDGILARIVDRRLGRAVRRLGVPAVDLRGAIPTLKLPHVVCDNRELVSLAFDHLHERGFRNFGFCGVPTGQIDWLDDRRERFVATVERAGFECHVFRARLGQTFNAKMREERPRIAAWLRKLPKPIGILAANDDRGQQVLDACLQAGFRAPDHVAVVGADNDEFLCNLSTPRLTSIEMNVEEVGYQAASLLNRMMNGQRRAAQQIPIRALRLVPRDSTDVMAVEDPELAAGLRFVREHACRPIGVNDLALVMHASRRVIERRFREHLGRTPHDEIMRVRLERAKLLLAESDLPMQAVAQRTGFATTSHFCHFFRRRIGESPAAWRTRHTTAR